MRIKLVEPVRQDTVQNDQGRTMYIVRPITSDSPKYQPLLDVLRAQPCPEFLTLGQLLLNYLRNSGFPCKAATTLEHPLYLMTDFSDPRPLQGLRIQDEEGTMDLPDLFFLGFYTDWDNLADSGVSEIFGHEYAHLWFYLLNFDPDCRRGAKFHTCTAVTDVFTAFFEGFAEHLQIVTGDLSGQGGSDELWDYALNVQAWLCARDQQLRNYAVKNNRFVYQTALPDPDKFSSYADLHMDHITSSAFTPERLKNGSQILASEGVVAAVFYRIYSSSVFKNKYCSQEFYRLFGTSAEEVSPVQNLYLKVFHALAKTDLQSPRLFPDFIRTYGECFPEEREELVRLFLELTHYTTVSHEAAGMFGNFYTVGRRGNIAAFKRAYKEMSAFKEKVLAGVIKGEVPLDAALYPEIWVTGKRCVPPVPWEVQQVPYAFDLNTASEVDFLALDGVNWEAAKAMVTYREANQGFKSLEHFQSAFSR